MSTVCLMLPHRECSLMPTLILIDVSMGTLKAYTIHADVDLFNLIHRFVVLLYFSCCIIFFFFFFFKIGVSVVGTMTHSLCICQLAQSCID